MKYLLPLIMVFSVQTASAEVIKNIYGISDRLEALKCDGEAYVTNKSNLQKIDQAAEVECKDVPEDQSDACYKKVAIKHSAPANVFFLGLAIPGKKEFEMVIKSKNSNQRFFNSLREGFHGDGMGGAISLMFNRAGVSPDEFLIETALLSEDGKSTPIVFVPVKRRLLADQIYFFFDCKLEWHMP